MESQHLGTGDVGIKGCGLGKPMGNPWETHGKPMVNPRVNDFFGWLDGVIMLKRITSPKDKHGNVEDCS